MRGWIGHRLPGGFYGGVSGGRYGFGHRHALLGAGGCATGWIPAIVIGSSAIYYWPVTLAILAGATALFLAWRHYHEARP